MENIVTVEHDDELAALAREIQDLEAETFEVVDFVECGEIMLGASTSCASTSTCSATTSTTSCSA